jgi:hypothetical protein
MTRVRTQNLLPTIFPVNSQSGNIRRMTFEAYCPECEKTVTASPMLNPDAFWMALKSDADVEAMHVPGGKPDHRWKLNQYERKNLLRAHWEGLV